MIGAGIYGFADYKKTNLDKKFTNMYQDQEVTKTLETGKKDISDSENVLEKKQPAAEKILPSPDKNEKITNSKMPRKEKATVSKIRKSTKRKVMSTKIFSRAPIREEIVYTDSVIKKTPGLRVVD